MGEAYDAPTDVVLSEHNVVQPDILYVCRERLGIVKEANIQGAPDLVLEILVYPMGTTLVSPLLPGFQVPVDQVFGQ